MKSFTLSEKLLNALLSYLASKPFAEVQGLIGGVQQELQAQAKQDEALPPKE